MVLTLLLIVIESLHCKLAYGVLNPSVLGIIELEAADTVQEHALKWLSADHCRPKKPR
jgi:hypothetical protein